MAQVVVINGYPGAGKDTFIKFCREAFRHTYNFHTSDPAKAALTDLGWKGDWDSEKTPEVRKLLADLMAFSYKYDGPFNYIDKCLAGVRGLHGDNAVVFVHCREYHNVVKFRQRFNALTLFVQRDSIAVVTHNNESDKNAGEFKEGYDYTVYNNGSLTALAYSANVFMVVAAGRDKRC